MRERKERREGEREKKIYIYKHWYTVDFLYCFHLYQFLPNTHLIFQISNKLIVNHSTGSRV